MPDTYTTISQLPDLGSVEATDRLVLDRLGAAVAAGSFVVGQSYQIVTVGTTSFITIGAASNTVGAYFVASGAGSGTGTAAPINTGDAAASAMPVSTATQAALDLKANANDARLSDSREWSAATATQAEAEAGSSTTRLAFTPQRVFQAIAAWWAASAAKAKLDGIATGATANATDAQLRDRSTHTGTQTVGTITGLGTLATQSGTFSGTSSGTNTGDQDLSGLAVKANNLSDLANAATARTNLGLGTAATAASGDFLPTTFTAGTITYAAQVTLDMAALAGGYRSISPTGALEFLASNRASGRQVTIRLICDSTARALTFPAGWVFLGTKPSTLAASKTAVLSLTFFGTADADCVAAYGVQA